MIESPRHDWFKLLQRQRAAIGKPSTKRSRSDSRKDFETAPCSIRVDLGADTRAIGSRVCNLGIVAIEMTQEPTLVRTLVKLRAAKKSRQRASSPRDQARSEKRVLLQRASVLVWYLSAKALRTSATLGAGSVCDVFVD